MRSIIPSTQRRPMFSSFKSAPLLRLALLFFSLAVLTRISYYALEDGFSIRRIEAPISFHGDIAVQPPTKSALDKLSTITGQHFRYLKKGSQAYAFISDDGRYILKLFKLHHMQPAEWLLSFPAPGILQRYRDNLVYRRRARIELTLTSYKLASEYLINECGLVYAQVLPSSGFSLPVTIHDAIGRRYTLDLSQHGFAIQKRAELVLPSFDRWIKEKDLVHAKKAIDSLVALIALRSSKGIQDSDPDLHKNAGLIGTTAVLIDIGSFYSNPSITSSDEMSRDMKKVFNRFGEWLEKRSPELYNYLQTRLNDNKHARWTPPE
jgi:hypothetical protein